ncbi:MAG: hypothetical protein PHQ42_00445 [Patescibacteria group bacterium]|nr:hypothetical protein [Patescibacteria group bacterium]
MAIRLLVFDMKEKIEPQIDFSADAKDREKESYFENEKRPKYRYFYHGNFAPSLEEIKSSGVFKFREYFPNIYLSPLSSFRFLESEIRKGPQHMLSRGKHLGPKERKNFKPEELTIEDSRLLVIEPTEEYKAHSTNEGKPNFFSTPDQIPADVDKTIRTRIWQSYQHMISKEPIVNKSEDGVRRPGIHLNKRMLPTGEWINVEREKRMEIPGEMPESSVKMVIKRDREFLKIFEDMRRELGEGGKFDLATYRSKLMDYFKNGEGIIKNEVEDEQELAENMVTGELENYMVTTMRSIYLDIERFKGKKFISVKDNKEENRPIRTKDQILDRINRLRTIEPNNEVFKRYMEIYTAGLEKELDSQ